MAFRTERLNGEIQKYVAEIISQELSDQINAFVGVTRVDTTKDLSYSKIYLSIYGKDVDKEAVFANIKRLSGTIRHHLAPKINHIRIIPELIFVMDDSLDYSEKINKIIDDLKK